MNALTILMMTHNELLYVQKAVETVRHFGDTEGLQLILADNHSTDGTREWAQCQEDLTYVLMEEREEGYAKIVNDVWRELHPEGDLLVMEARYALTPFCLSEWQKTLYADEKMRGGGGLPDEHGVGRSDAPCRQL